MMASMQPVGHRHHAHHSLSSAPYWSGSDGGWRNFLPSLLVAQLLFWLMLACMYVRYTSLTTITNANQAVALSTDADNAQSRRRQEKAMASAVRLVEEGSVTGAREGGKGGGGIPGADARGWMTSPMDAANLHGLPGATACVDVQVGTIGPGASRGNHFHTVKNESFLVWGAKATWRLGVAGTPSEFHEVALQAGDVTVVTATVGRAHALRNVDKSRALNIVVCADAPWDPQHPKTVPRVWSNL